MFGNVISMVATAISSALLWLDKITSFIPGSVAMMLASFVIYTSVRLLIKPLVGYASSDLATGKLKAKKREKQKAQKAQKKG